MKTRVLEISAENGSLVTPSVVSRPKSRLYDRPDSFGWLSIALHWLTAVLIIAMWIIGQNISVQPDGSPDAYRELHVTLGLSVWILLAGRILWRARVAHPKADGVGERTHRFARAFHYLMLATLSVLILSGPVVAWAGYPSTVGQAAFTAHRYAGNTMFALVLLHILGALKHLMFHHDDSIIRMLWPKR